MKTKINSLLCRFLGHTKSGHITGFRHDGIIITYCSRCDVPIVDSSYKASSRIVDVITQDQYKRLGIKTNINDNIQQKASQNTGLEYKMK